MKVPFKLVDVFGERPFTGNQLCVIPDPGDLSSDQMQMLALEIGVSETTFVTSTSASSYSMRVFTPGGELPFAGHPTLGTAYVLVSEGRVSSPAVQTVTAGEFQVWADPDAGTAQVLQLPPDFGEEVNDRKVVAEAAGLAPVDLHTGLAPRVVSTGLAHLMVPAASISAVRHANPDLRSLKRLTQHLNCDGYYLFALTDEGATARLFAPEVGVAEDAATGSAAGPLAAYLASEGVHTDPLTIRQGEEIGRPSLLLAQASPSGQTWEVRVGGNVWIVGEGSFDI
ncbi:MAG: PhzF family phenazine biosynthesis protein [Actinobacteria bacterium]|nr:PhzF family phenazine biosynthesis protein [Actinomycetota bacterium]